MNQYDTIGVKYYKCKQQPWRKYVEEYTLNKMLGDINDKTILDLACGDGFYSRKFSIRNPKKIVGVDISKEMIVLANEWSTKFTNIEYINKDACDVDLPEKFDIVTGIYLLCYAQTETQLNNFVKTIKKHLKNDGIFIGINDNIMQSISNYKKMKKYGFEKSIDIQENGQPIKYDFYDDDGSFICCFDDYYLSKKIYENAFLKNNLIIEWIFPELDPEENNRQEYWNDFLTDPPIIGLIAKHITI